MSGHRVAAALAVAAACAWFTGAGAPAALAGKCTRTVAPSGTIPDYAQDGGPARPMDYFLAAGPGTHPAVLVIDGGSWKSSCKEDVGPDAKHFSQNGYVAFAPNFRRACDGRNKLCGYHAPETMADLRLALRYIRSHAAQYHVDPTRVAAMGVSSGGQLAYMLGESGVAGDTRADVTAGFSGDADLPYACQVGILAVCADRANWIGCTLNACPSQWATYNPTAQASRSSAPTFIASGQKDTRVRIAEAEHLANALSSAGATVLLCEIKTGQHSQDLEPLPCTTGGSQSSWARMIAFFNAQL